MSTTGIEDLVRWAWIDELSKVPPEWGFRAPASLGFGNSWAARGDLPDDGGSRLTINRFGAVFSADRVGEPHPDALAVARAVSALDDLVVEEPAEIDWFGAWGDLDRLGEAALARAWGLVVREAEPARKGGEGAILQGLASSIVVRTAIVDQWPDWRGVAPVVVPDVHPGGQPKWVRTIERAVGWDGAGQPTRFELVEVDGFNRVSQRPHPGARRAERLDPDPAPVLAERIRWAMIHAWFTALAGTLDGIGGRVVLPPDRPAAPWIA